MPRYIIYRLNHLCFILILISSLAGCSSRKSVAGDRPAGRLDFTGWVVYQDIEGGFYGIRDKDGHQFEPVNLPDDLKIDGLSVIVTAEPLPGTSSTHMWGTVIRIMDIKRLPTPDRN
jgi:hypothetical protein